MWHSLRRYHFFYLRKGFYRFLRKLSVQFVLLAALVLGALAAFEALTPGLGYYFSIFTQLVSKEMVLAFFFLSETMLGLIPPDLFIVWADQFSSPYLMVGLLALLSYAAGLLSYYLGRRLVRWSRVSGYINERFSKHFGMLRNWGGFLIVIAALFPLPFSTMCMGAGMLRYSFRSLAILGTFRILRFFVYALFIFQMI